jgi:hypothetical protein
MNSRARRLHCVPCMPAIVSALAGSALGGCGSRGSTTSTATGNVAGPAPTAELATTQRSAVARVIASRIPGAGAITRVSAFHPGGPIHDNPAFAARTSRGRFTYVTLGGLNQVLVHRLQVLFFQFGRQRVPTARRGRK